MLRGLKLKIKRIEMGIKAQDIAKMIGVERSYISKMETEVQGIPLHIYEKWVGVLGLDIK
jgi:predicted transcriptional regulator